MNGYEYEYDDYGNYTGPEYNVGAKVANQIKELKVLQFRAWCSAEGDPPSLASQFDSTLAKFRAGAASLKSE